MYHGLATCWILLYALLPSSSKIASASLYRRKSDPSLETLFIPLTVDNDQHYSTAVSMGSDEQDFRFVLTTGTGYSVVAQAGCNECNGALGYNASKSTTEKQLSDVETMSVLGKNATGGLILENCQLTQANGSAWPYPNQTLIVANTSSGVFSSGISGVIGLGTNGRNGDFSATVFSGWLSRNPEQENFTYGMMLNPPWNSGGNGGVLHWQAPDTTSYEGDVVWKSFSDFNSTSSIQFDWYIPMDSLLFTDGGNVNVSQSGNLITAVDPFESAMIFPQNVAGSIYGGIAGSTRIPSLVTNQWSIPCDTKMKLTLTFGDLSVSMDETTLVQANGTTCFGTIEEWSDAQVQEYFLGSSFISLVYLIYSISGSSPGQGSVGFANRSSPNDGITGAQIAGIVLGTAALVILCCLILFLLYRRYRRRRRRELPTPFTTPPPTPGRPLLDDSRRAENFTPSPPFHRQDFGIMSPHSYYTYEFMQPAALPSSVYTHYQTPLTPTTPSSWHAETPPPYNLAPQRAVRPQKSQMTLPTVIA